MLTKQVKILLAVSLQVLIILSIIIFKVSILSGGSEVMLKIAPVDPRDPLRGDYVTFRYDISDIKWHLAKSQRDLIKNGDTVYVVLQKQGEYWIAKKVWRNKPTKGELFIKGTVESGPLERPPSTPGMVAFNNSNIRLRYGIEQYFIPEGTGQNFNFRNKEAAASVAIDENGNAVLKEIYVDGEIWP